MPNSAKWPRKAFTSIVRCRIKKLADAMQHQHALLLLALCRNKAHRRSRDRLADCLGIRSIILLPLHVWHDV